MSYHTVNMDGVLDLTAKVRTVDEDQTINDLETSNEKLNTDMSTGGGSLPESPGSGSYSVGDASTPMKPEQRAFYPTPATLLAALANNVLKSNSLNLPPTFNQMSNDEIALVKPVSLRYPHTPLTPSATPPPIAGDEISYAYWERRRRNNEAAKRSRDTRRAKEEEVALRAALLEQENLKLRAQVAILKNETAKLHYMLYNAV